MSKNENKYFTIISHLFGISLKKGLDNLKLGNYTICDTNFLYKNYPDTKKSIYQTLENKK